MFSQVSIIHSVEGVSLVHVPSGYRVYTPPPPEVGGTHHA